MLHYSIILGLLAGVAFVSAAPAPTLVPDLAKRATCTFADAASAINSKTSCATIVLSGIAVPSGTTLDLKGLNPGTQVIFEGTTTFGYEEWSGPLISISGANIVVIGAPGSLIDVGGERWWDSEGGNGGKTKPKFFYAHSLTGNSSITGLNVKNTPVQAFSINGASGLTLSNIVLDNSAGDAGGLGHNTDAFDISSSENIVISGANVMNQDDCLAINSGIGITFTGGNCTGGHGLSIGSVGGRSDNTVRSVVIENSCISNSQNGIRIKTVAGATGSVSGVTYTGITLSNISKYGIIIEQDYQNGSPTGTPTAGVPITDLTLCDITGTTASDGTNIHVLCAAGACSNWSWNGVSVAGGKTSYACKNVPSGASC